jgi:hypothetical protein
MNVNLVRQALAVAALVAVAASVADARHNGKPGGRHHQAGPAATIHPTNHAKGAARNGPRPGTSGPAGVNVDLIFVRPPARDAKHAVKPLTKRTAAAPTGSRRQRIDPAAAAKNAIGIANRASVDPTGRPGPLPNAIGAAKRDLAHVAPRGSPQAPAGGARGGTNVGPVNVGRATVGPAGIPAPSPHGGGISGTGLGRSGSGPATIGGPAKLAAGVTGTGLRPKR